MKLILEGDDKKVNQIYKELIYRCKRDKIQMTLSDVEIKQVEKVEKPKKLK